VHSDVVEIFKEAGMFPHECGIKQDSIPQETICLKADAPLSVALSGIRCQCRY